MADQKVRYALPLTIVRIDGTVTVSTTASGEKQPVRTSEVSLGVQADPHNVRDLLLTRDWAKKHEFEVKLAPDERLSGASASSTGLGAQVVAAGLRIATLAVKLAPAVLVAAPEGALEPETVEETLEEEDPVLARRRKAYREALAALQDKLADLATETAQNPDAAVHERIKATETALTAVREELARLEAQFDDWRAKRFPDWTTTYSYALGVDTLPRRTTARETVTLTEEDLEHRKVAKALRTLGVAVVKIGDRDPTRHTADFPDNGVEYRRPRLCQLGVYETPGDQLPGTGVEMPLRRLMPAWIVDSWSITDFVPFESGGIFDERSAGVEFGDSGTLSKLTNKSTGAAEALATAASGAGASIVESLEQAGKIADAFPAPADPELKALKDQVTRKELEAKLAKANKTIAEAGNTTNSTT